MRRFYAMLICTLGASLTMAVQVLVQGNAVNIQGPDTFLGLGPTNAVPWTPASVTNTMLQWLRGEEMTGVDGSVVTTWPHFVFGKDAIAGGNAPTLRIFGALPWQRYAEFDGLANYLATGDWTTQGYVAPFTWGISFRKRAIANGTGLQVLLSSNASAEIGYDYLLDDNNTYDIYAGFLNGTGPAANDTTSWHTMLVTWTSTNAFYSFDGSAMTMTPQSDVGPTPMWGIVLGCHGDLLDYPGAYDIAEVIVWDGVLNSTNITGVNNYFSSRH